MHAHNRSIESDPAPADAIQTGPVHDVDEVVALRAALAEQMAIVAALQSSRPHPALQPPCSLDAAATPSIASVPADYAISAPHDGQKRVEIAMEDKENSQRAPRSPRPLTAPPALHQASSPLATAAPPSPRALSRAVEAEAEAARLRGELRTLRDDSRRQLDDAHKQLAECRAKLARTGSGSTPKSLSGGLARIDDQMVAMETEVARQRLELSLSQAQAARDAAERKVARQERVLSKLMSELREEKTKAARAHGAGTAVDRLRGEMSGQMSTATARLQGLQESVSRDVASATERLCASAASEHARTAQSVRELEAAASTSRMDELLAQEGRARSEAQVTVLEARVAAQARLVSACLRGRCHGVLEGEMAAEAQAERLLEAVAAETDDVAHSPATPSSGGRRLMGALADGVMRVASAAHSYSRGGGGGGGEGDGASVLAQAHYVRLLETELGTLAAELASSQQVARELERALREAERGACTDEEAAALAEAEAAADALLTSDHHIDDGCPREPDEKQCAELRQRAAAAALLEELRLEGAKSHRLEKIISRLMGELRTAKLKEAIGDEGKGALASFGAIAAKIEGALRDNAKGLSIVDSTLKSRFDAAIDQLRAIEGSGGGK